MRRLRFVLLALVVLIFSVVPARAQTADADEAPLGKRLQEYQLLEQRLTELFKQKEYDKAAEACHRQMQLVPESPEPHYNLACALARQEQKDAALLELSEAVRLGFTDSAHMREDDDLAALHELPKFKDLLKEARQKDLDAPHEVAAEIDGVKTIEGFPEGGLRYRLRIDPAAGKDKKARLMIWLHPSGESMDNVLEQMSPRFAHDGYALLVLTQKNYGFWSDPDVTALLDKTLPEVAKIDGVDAKKPILIGFSAGGQVALQLWRQHPDAYGGLVVDSAYPIDMEKYAVGKIEPFAIPKDPGIKSCPIFVLVGGADGGTQMWKVVEKSWRQAEIPLSVYVVPGAGHAWLFDGEHLAFLHDWLKQVHSGELPSRESKPKTSLPGDENNQTIKV
ncbi:MAG TPA: hypothetical protein VG326_02080 [Tepidisphaeraceae bacterium]|jgi:pimeloyl-ACP methyl ester carboxylesterase|nr:hypothetical protein [Tepidisphaeraceae bacterium]